MLTTFVSLPCLVNNLFSAKGLFWFSVKCLLSFHSSWCWESRVSNLPTLQIWLGPSNPSVMSDLLVYRVQAPSHGVPSPPCHGSSLAVALQPPLTLSSPYPDTSVPPSGDSLSQTYWVICKFLRKVNFFRLLGLGCYLLWLDLPFFLFFFFSFEVCSAESYLPFTTSLK